MPSPRALRLRESHQRALKTLAALSTADGTTLVHALRDADRSASPSEYAAIVSGVLPQLTGESRDLVDALISLDVLRSSQGWTVEETCSAIVRAPGVELEGAERDTAVERLSVLLATDSIWLTAKAYDMGTVFPWSLQSVRIVTDLRPIFDKIEDPPKSSLIVHQLVLTTYNDDGETKTVYVTLDDADLDDLKSQIDRAITKSKTLADFVAKMDVSRHRVEKE